MHSWSLKSIWWKPRKSPSPKIREYVLKLTIFQVLMENWYPFFESFSVSILQKMFSKLIFGYGKLIMRIYFAQIVIHIKIDFDFFIPSRVRIDHSEVVPRSSWSQYFGFMDFCNGQIAASFPNEGINSREKIFISHFIMKKYVLICSILTIEQMI